MATTTRSTCDKWATNLYGTRRGQGMIEPPAERCRRHDFAPMSAASAHDPHVNRRLAAVAFADLVDFSRHMELDDVRTLGRWKSLRSELIEPQLTEHHGRLLRVVGDGLLIEFHSAVDAVRWAHTVQKAIMADQSAAEPDPLRIRIGINVEDVIVEDDDIHGDGVNIAARIQQLAGPNEVVVTAAVRDYVWNKLDVELTDLGEHQLKNISRSVRVFRIEPATVPGSVRRAPAPRIEVRTGPSVAVLPFRNLGGNPEEDYFGEGITEDIITALSRFRSLFVIARNSTLHYRDRNRSAQQAAGELGVRYVLEGSVRRQVSRLRISSELIDASGNRTLWAERYDGANDDLFDFQDRIASSIVATIEPRLMEAESERARIKPTENLNAYDCVLRALPLLHTFDERQWCDASAFLDRAVTLDPSYAQAYAYRAWLHLLYIGEGRTRDINVDRAQALANAKKAMELDRRDAFVLALAAHMHSFLLGELDQAVQLFERALELNVNSAFAWGMSGHTYAYRGQAIEAMERIRRAWQLSPFDPYDFIFLVGAGMAEFIAGRYEDAIIWLRKALRGNPRFLPTHRHLVTSLAHADRLDEARAAAAELLKVEPGFRVSVLASWYPLRPRENLQRYMDGLRAAGLPE